MRTTLLANYTPCNLRASSLAAAEKGSKVGSAEGPAADDDDVPAPLPVGGVKDGPVGGATSPPDLVSSELEALDLDSPTGTLWSPLLKVKNKLPDIKNCTLNTT